MDKEFSFKFMINDNKIKKKKKKIRRAESTVYICIYPMYFVIEGYTFLNPFQ